MRAFLDQCLSGYTVGCNKQTLRMSRTVGYAVFSVLDRESGEREREREREGGGSDWSVI